jgi:hypothetical protein
MKMAMPWIQASLIVGYRQYPTAVYSVHVQVYICFQEVNKSVRLSHFLMR